jgi:hypothetical protein|tara:strand:+ start:250 stop:705 length:456 start_codon:yes stop_codon:yes gene_type:complete
MKMINVFVRRIVFSLFLLGSTLSVGFASELSITVWKTSTCGCCLAWVDYLGNNGFTVTAYDVEDVVPIKQELGLTNPALYSCHTALIDGYIVEGHVPVSDIRRLLAERPEIIGITAPGMPQMSPGMHSIEPKGYDVLQFNSHQQLRVFSRY